ncbi:MAG: prpE [Acidimicrobiales bacterium]|nr:prpE [Acidimicrobiales bacterium]
MMTALGTGPGRRRARTASVVSTTLPAHAASAGAARRFVTAALTRWCVEDLDETATLLVSELVTNAVLHAGSGVLLRIARTSDGIRCEVIDRGPGRPVMHHADPEDVNGRGLELVDDMSRAWGVAPAVGGKSVWFELVRAQLLASSSASATEPMP